MTDFKEASLAGVHSSYLPWVWMASQQFHSGRHKGKTSEHNAVKHQVVVKTIIFLFFLSFNIQVSFYYFSCWWNFEIKCHFKANIGKHAFS